MLFAHLHRTESRIPFTPCPWTGDGLHIFHHGIREWQNGLEVSDDAGFGLPPTACRGWDTSLAVMTVIKALRASPLAKSTSTPHGSPCLDGLLDVIGCFRHEIDHAVFGPNDAEAFKLTAWVDAYHKRLIVRLLFVGELYVEQA